MGLRIGKSLAIELGRRCIRFSVGYFSRALRSEGRLPPPLSDTERETRRLEREFYRLECDQRREQRRLERERIEAETAAVAASQARQKAQHELRERDKERRREQQLVGLEIKTAQARGWMEGVENNARIGQYFRQRQAIMDELGGIINPPPPEPEPQPEYPPAPKIGDPDFWEKWNARRPLRSWF